MSKTQQVGPTSKSEITQFSSPQARFHNEPKFIKEHQDLVDSPAFDRGADAAMSQYVATLSEQANDPNGAMGVGFQLRGAVNFLRQFKTLAEQPKPLAAKRDPSSLQPTEPQRRA